MSGAYYVKTPQLSERRYPVRTDHQARGRILEPELIPVQVTLWRCGFRTEREN